jgi:hypothetical protein
MSSSASVRCAALRRAGLCFLQLGQEPCHGIGLKDQAGQAPARDAHHGMVAELAVRRA